MNKINCISQKIFSLNVANISKDDVDSITKDLTTIFLEPANTTEMCRQNSSTNKCRKPKTDKPWFNSICKDSKNN